MLPPYDHQALWAKAKLFMNRAMDDDASRAFDEQALWGALSLELLGKAALSRNSPVLIAEPTEEGQHLLIASGLVKGEVRFTSVRAKTIFKRCQRAFRPFNSDEAIAITNARNEYLHGGGVGFTSVPSDVWWSKLWAQAVVLVSALDKEIEDLVGYSRVRIVEKHLEQNAKNVEHRTEMLIERAKQRLEQYRDGSLPAKISSEWNSGLALSASLQYTAGEICPACLSSGLLEGDNVSGTAVDSTDYSEEGESFGSIVTLTIDADYFSCPTCHLVLDGVELLSQAGLSTTFESEGDIDDLYEEPDYGND